MRYSDISTKARICFSVSQMTERVDLGRKAWWNLSGCNRAAKEDIVRTVVQDDGSADDGMPSLQVSKKRLWVVGDEVACAIKYEVGHSSVVWILVRIECPIVGHLAQRIEFVAHSVASVRVGPYVTSGVYCAEFVYTSSYWLGIEPIQVNGVPHNWCLVRQLSDLDDLLDRCGWRKFTFTEALREEGVTRRGHIFLQRT